MKKRVDAALKTLRECLDSQTGRYRELRGVKSFGAYLDTAAVRADEEILTEPVLQSIMERVLRFPSDAYVPQWGKGGLKPDITPIDLIAHPFVLDAKSSDERFEGHEAQIRRYMSQRSLDFGVLFNLRELRVYRRRDVSGHDPERSFSLLRLWHIARGEALPTGDLEAFEHFLEDFSYREMGVADQIKHVRQQSPWPSRLAGGEPVEVDTEYLVEKLRLLSRELVEDAEEQFDRLLDYLSLNPGREHKLIEELEMLALDIAPGTRIDELPQTIAEWRNGEGLLRRVWRQYLLRVVYLVLTRILLYRAWEDVEFVHSYLYDGGFDQEYERLSQDVRRVLSEAFLHGSERYPWLYGRENNYSWYQPRPPALARVLYLLAPVPLGKLDADALGGLYESYVDEIDRDRLGQFFTPRSVVRFMLDRAGFDGADGVFRLEGDRRRPKRIFDFATGSGGFLVESARRIIDEGGIKDDDEHGLREALAAIVSGLVGGEISPFPYYLTEINLLLQVSRLLGKLALLGQTSPTFTLGVLHVDSLGAKSSTDRSLELDPALRVDQAELVHRERFDLVPLDGEKLEIYRALRGEDGGFDLVVGNPPYVTEANNKPLFDGLRNIAAWKGIYRGKTDYSYYFLLLALEKLAPGGRLCVITPAGWMNAGAADFLRKDLAEQLQLDELFLFGSHRLFAPERTEGRSRKRVSTPTVESAILVATKASAPKGHKLRVVALEDEAEAARALSGNPDAKTPDRDELLTEMARRAKGRAGRKGGIHVHDVPQSELQADRPWRVKHSTKDISTRIVEYLDRAIADNSQPVEKLSRAWSIFMGIETGADSYTRRIWKRLTAPDRSKLEASGLQIGDPILQLPPGEERVAPWSKHPELLAKAPEPTGILYAALDPDDFTHYVRIDRGQQVPDDVRKALEPWETVLSTRAEIARNSARKWWETVWPRDIADLKKPKIIALHRTDRGRFGLDEAGEWKSGKATAVIVSRSETGGPVAYACGVLNSELLDLWYALRGRSPRDVWRDYEPKRMNEIPYRRPDGDPRADEVADLVRGIAANRRALLPHRSVVRDLGRIVKDPWKDGPVVIDRAALLAELTESEKISVRLDPALELTHGEPPFGHSHRLDEQTLVFEHSRTEKARISGDETRIDLLSELLAAKAPDDLDSILLPSDLSSFSKLAEERAELVRNLLAEGRRLVEQVERLVCALYDLPAELTDEVVAHAVKRAGSRG